MMLTQSELNDRIETAKARVVGLPATEESSFAPVALTPAEAAALIDHTLLKPEAGAGDIRRFCAEAAAYNFASVCVNPTWVPLCVELLADSSTKVCTVVGFPLGANATAVKVFEAINAVDAGAEEIDMVLNIGRLRDGEWSAVHDDVAQVAAAVHERGVLLKVILETCLLTDEQKIAACVICQAAGADFVKTSTGLNKGGATFRDVALMRATVGPEMGVKAAGGVRSAEDVGRMVAAGATRIGASGGIGIVDDLAGVGAGSAGSARAVPESGAY